MTPVDAVRVSPGGEDPDTTVQLLYAGTPPLVTRVVVIFELEVLAIARSGLPTPSKSATTTDTGEEPAP
jgi:hypothetical protein